MDLMHPPGLDVCETVSEALVMWHMVIGMILFFVLTGCFYIWYGLNQRSIGHDSMAEMGVLIAAIPIFFVCFVWLPFIIVAILYWLIKKKSIFELLGI